MRIAALLGCVLVFGGCAGPGWCPRPATLDGPAPGPQGSRRDPITDSDHPRTAGATILASLGLDYLTGRNCR